MARTHFTYLLCYKDNPVAHAKHYVGSAADVLARLGEHQAGRGARLTQVAVARGAHLEIVRTWRGGRDFERALKQSYKHCFTSLCPLCTPGAGTRRARTFKP